MDEILQYLQVNRSSRTDHAGSSRSKVQTGIKHSKCSCMEAFFLAVVEGYKYLFEEQEQDVRSAHMNVVSKPKWQ
jgi:hypothetical protein